ncbi:MAG TPA: FprA family A-type flavoprotein [Candidatus Aminicenantes bacterium]|nr:FprA family A-type flavoprotein [Candidatus Aminicenantes bacterium]HRY65373.1 FprA family A-type flavoprotein [Candidatus Aminicenantes bacterium]HRZ72159.1 FprA family A-type flavoprotein [Candidatus Aminicenantes bacterium]
MKPREIVPGVHYVGAPDFDRRLFDALIPLPDGTSYNSYLVRGRDKVALIDAVEPAKLPVLEAYLEEVPRIDYLVSNHTEQDHSGGIPWLVRRYPGIQVLSSEPARLMLADHLGLDPARIRAVADGERLDLGGKTLRFVYTPWVHWPETMSTYLEEDGILFSCDFFGSHIAQTDLFVDGADRILAEAKRYYAEIMMPFRKIVQKDLDKIKDLDIRLIAPSHGPIHRDPASIIGAYRDWSDDKPHNTVVLPWATMHGSTALMVERLITALVERGLTVHPFNMAAADIGQLAMALVDAATIVVGAPTVHVGPHPVVFNAVVLANALRPKARFASIVGSYGWAGRMPEMIKAAMPNLKVEILPPVVAKGLPKPADLEALDALAAAIAAKHKEAGLF